MSWFTNYLSPTFAANAPALTYKDKQMTYQELGAYARYYANVLVKQYDIKPGQFVGLMMDPCLELFPMLHAIWLVGAAYVPLNPKLTSERLEFIISQAEVDLVVTEPKRFIDFSIYGHELGKKINVFMPSLVKDNIQVEDYLDEASAPQVAYDELRPAYMIYTSGTTGQPKGVVCIHRGLENLCHGVIEIFELDDTSRILQFSRPSFDAMEFEAYPAFCAGSTVVMGDRDDMLPGKRLAMFILNHQATHLVLPPTILYTMNHFIEQLDVVRYILLEGEKAPPKLSQRWIANGKRRVFNGYGPSEGTVCSTYHEVTNEDTSEVPIGVALPGIQTYVLDEDNNPCAPGNPGTLWIGGKGLAQGYHSRPELTAEKFCEPLAGAGRLYNTGDQVIEDDEGVLHFLGRVDSQVKIRGIRIELEAIEQELTNCPHVSIGAIKVFEVNTDQGSNKVLVAYVCPYTGESIDEQEVRSFLASKLPEYSHPHMYVILETMPLMPNLSKIDKKALPTPEELQDSHQDVMENLSSRTAKYTYIKDPLKQVCAFFDTVLRTDDGVSKEDTDFFASGGDSLNVTQLLDMIEDRFDVPIPPRIVYDNPTPLQIVALFADGKVPNFNADNRQAVAKEMLNHGQYQIPHKIPNYKPCKPHKIFLTGATGFLGIHTLKSLLSHEQVSEVFCLVRAKDEAHGMQRLIETMEKYHLQCDNLEKIVVTPGNITQSQLGMSSAHYQHTSAQADAVIHAAASISYISAYSEIIKPNVKGTKEILDFCCTTKIKPLHHVSSMSVFGASHTLLGLDTVYEDFDIMTSLPVMAFENGYTRAKWVAEHMVNEAKKQGLPVSIYRPGFIQGHSETGVSNMDDLFCRLVVGNLQMGYYPDFSDKYWLPVPVDFVADAMVEIVLSQEVGLNYHLITERKDEPSNNELFALIATLGHTLEKVPFSDWIEKVRNLPADNALFPLIRFLTEKVFYGERTVYEMHHITSVADCQNTLNALQHCRITCPPIDGTLLKCYVKYYLKQE